MWWILLALACQRPPPERCDNGRDDDGDGWVDCADQDCTEACTEDCDNGADDDGDTLVDCRDPGCEAECVEDCTNGVDDDGDDAVDCFDATCAAQCPEDCANGVDDNGDLVTDCADVLCASTCDGDGDGYDGPQVGGDDCDDGDAAIHPGQPELYYNGADDDCDAATADDDQDADGWAVDADCDDTAAATFPGAPETCGDGQRNDCDAVSDPPRETCYGERSLATADRIVVGTEPDGFVGASVAAPGDADGDGEVDLVIGAYGVGLLDAGAAYVLSGPIPTWTDLPGAACALTGAGDGDNLGLAVGAVPDVTGDGRPDAVAGAPYADFPGSNTGRAYLVLAACVSGPVDASASAFAGDEYDQVGQAFAGGDLNGDGDGDLALGVPNKDLLGLTDNGGTTVQIGPVSGGTIGSAAALFAGEHDDDESGRAVAIADLDGDGLVDLAIGAPYADANGADAGAIYVVLAPIPAGIRSLAGFTRVPGPAASAEFGWSLAALGDVSGDGVDDLAVGAPTDAAGAGTVAVLDSPSPAGTIATLTGAAGSALGSAVAAPRDVDGDGRPDLAAGAPSDDTAADDAGAAFVWFAPLVGDLDVAGADVRLLGAAAYDYAGTAVATAGDVDGDGFGDLLVGAPFHDTYGPSDGAVYLLTFGL